LERRELLGWRPQRSKIVGQGRLGSGPLFFALADTTNPTRGLYDPRP
jgi:hypothetical protein